MFLMFPSKVFKVKYTQVFWIIIIGISDVVRYSRCSYLRDFVGNDVKIPFFILAATEMKICCCK